ncbi:ammonium transporter [Dactylococcopsis salina]|uniref:Ammonia permease n=1 Tax=Dactylococcopsis salina (strain PCC 8305) TaxID=13035 RepID=K9Z0D3_DACS8|nr:ammonium transporter [Dactylococcopsis salina]AFZ52040.1 ammonia permease [Dactylococcopsis salina PCC 8305]
MSAEAQNFLATFVTETYYYWASVFMLVIHVGFLAYEGGAARTKNVLSTMVKNLLTLAVVGLSFFFIGWWVYAGFSLWPLGPLVGPWTSELPETVGELSTEGLLGFVETTYPWSEAMGPNVADNITGVFFFAFSLFAMTTASIMSGAVIERIRLGAYLILATLLGSFCWVVAAAWGWNYWGWFNLIGYHDFGCSAVVHGVSGFFALGVLINLGPRIGRYDQQGKPRGIPPHNLPLTMVGLLLIFVGFYAFLAACVIFAPGYTNETSIYGTPATLSSIAVNTTLALCSGLVGAYIGSKGDPFFTISGGLAGIISVGAGLDLYAPQLVIPIAFIGALTMPWVGMWIEKIGIDDAVGAFAVHGYCGLLGAMAVGVMATGYQIGNYPAINFFGQLLGAFLCTIVLGLIPGYFASLALKKFGLLRVPVEEEMEGLDLGDFGITGYPEYSLIAREEAEEMSFESSSLSSQQKS